MIESEKTLLKIAPGYYGYPRVMPVTNRQQLFPHDEWVPAIKNIETARTYKEQKVAMTTGILSVSAYTVSLIPKDQIKAETHLNGTRARFALDEVHGGLVGRLRSLTTLLPESCGLVTIGYQSPESATHTPAFAVIEAANTSNFAVIRDPDEELTDLSIEISTRVANSLAHKLDNYYPGFEIFDKLEAA